MRNLYFVLIFCLAFTSGCCCRKKNRCCEEQYWAVDPNQEQCWDFSYFPYVAANGTFESKGNRYPWIDTSNGPIILDFAEVCGGVITNQNLWAKKSDLGSLSIGGKAWITDTVVHEPSHIKKCLDVYHSQFESCLAIGGDLDADDVIFCGKLTVSGGFTVRRSCFYETPVVSASMVCIESSNLPGLIVRAGCGLCSETQIVRISNCSAVDGDICFESGRGKVLIDATSCFSGRVKGGVIIRELGCNDTRY